MATILSKNLKTLRTRKGFSQYQIAKLVGTTGNNWSSYERGKTEPSVSTLVKLSLIFQLSIDKIVLGYNPLERPGVPEEFIRDLDLIRRKCEDINSSVKILQSQALISAKKRTGRSPSGILYNLDQRAL